MHRVLAGGEREGTRGRGAERRGQAVAEQERIGEKEEERIEEKGEEKFVERIELWNRRGRVVEIGGGRGESGGDGGD